MVCLPLRESSLPGIFLLVSGILSVPKPVCNTVWYKGDEHPQEFVDLDFHGTGHFSKAFPY